MPQLDLNNSIVDGRYLVDRCLSCGSYAEIFLASDLEQSREPVIIKALNTSLQGTIDLDLERTLIANFENEAIALDKVVHPNIIRRLGHGTAADLQLTPFHYLVLEYMPGGDLLSLCRKGRMQLNDVTFIFGQVARALAHAHDQQVIHRDIKPTNLLLSIDQRTIKIADFGVAKITPDAAAEITRVGTNIYAAPEHHPDALGNTENERLTPSADIYSLAKTIYTSITGKAPHQFSRNQIDALPEGLAAESWGAALLAVLRKATATQVSERYQSVEEFWTAFSAIQDCTAPAECDLEATVVRKRSSENEVKTAPDGAMPEPAKAEAPPIGLGRQIEKDRIVVELSPAATAPADFVTTPAPYRPPAKLNDNGGLKPAEPSPAEQPKTRESSIAVLRRHWRGNWLRNSFILFLIAAFVGLVISTYYNFAARGPGLPSLFQSSYGEGLVTGALNVNLRSEPNGNVLVWLPAGTRVRVFETKNGWARVKVLKWAGAVPDGAPENGWLDKRYVQLD